MTKIALAGTGPWSDVWARTIGPERLHGRCSGRDAQEVQEMLRGATHCIVANHPAGHEAVVMAALERGVPVLCEKPCALDLVAVRRMFERASLSSVNPRMLSVSYPHLWAYMIRGLHAMGVKAMRGQFTGPSSHDYSPLLDWGAHALSMLCAFASDYNFSGVHYPELDRASISLHWPRSYQVFEIEFGKANGKTVELFGSYNGGLDDTSFLYKPGPEPDGKTPMHVALGAFVTRPIDHWQFDPAITLRTHELLEEICHE